MSRLSDRKAARPDYAAKAREIRDQLCCEDRCTGTLPGCGCYDAILSALREADAAATERAAKVAEQFDCTAFARRTGCNPVIGLVTAIRNQEPTDADA